MDSNSTNIAISSDVLSSIYLEAILFVAIFGVMSIVSFVISKKNAKKYESTKEYRDSIARKEEKIVQKEIKTDKRVAELEKMLSDKLISEDEFKMLKSNI